MSACQATSTGAVHGALVIVAAVLLPGHIPETALLALGVVAGLPHGAMDYLVGQRTFGPAYGASWWRPFLAGYLSLVAATLLLWWAVPAAALLAFLLLAMFHFGSQDAGARTPDYLMRVVAHGGAVIVVPAACHPVAVAALFAILAPAQAPAITMALAEPLLVIWAIAAVGTLIGYAGFGRARETAAAIDLLLVAMLFAVATPLIAFSLYFAAIHTPRALAAQLPASSPAAGMNPMPVILTLLGLGLGVAIFAARRSISIDDNLVRSTFILLSALTVPHMWLEWRRGTAGTPAHAIGP